MGQFKPMVKMMTTEPSVILKLKKGGKVEKKADGGFMPMQSTMPAGLPARGGLAPAASPARPSLAARRRAMNPNLLMKKGGEASCEKVEKELKAHEGKSAGKAHKGLKGGGNVSEFANTKMHDGDKADKAHGTKGVKTGNAGGYADGGTIKGNVAKFAKTKVVDGDKADKAKGTGNVRMGNSGGYKKGGKVDWENRPADTSKPGVTNTTTGGVKEANAGGYKKGGSAKKAYAAGGNVVDDGKAVKMPRHFVSRPVANSLQSGTFKKGGKVKKFAEGDVVEDLSKGAYDKSIGPDADDLAMARSIRNAPFNAIDALKKGVKSFIARQTGPYKDNVPAGSVTKTEKSVTVAPPTKKRGGKVC